MYEPRQVSFAATIGGTLVSLVLLSSAASAQSPALSPGGSPGGSDEGAVLRQRCPTFSWSEVSGATGYELEISSPGRVEALRVELPAGSLSWTPAEGDCFEPGAEAWWRIRARLTAEAGAWSSRSRLAVRPSSSPLATARRLLGRLAESRLTEDQRLQLAHLGWPAKRAPVHASVASAHGEGESSQALRRSQVQGRGLHALSPGMTIDSTDNIAISARGTGVSVWGESAAANGIGIYSEVHHGESSFTTVAIEGVNTVDLGILGQATANPNATGAGATGLRGESAKGAGVHGYAEASSGSTIGVYGQSASPSSSGVCARATGSNNPIGVYGATSSSGGFDFYAGGNGSYGTFTGGHEVRLLAGPVEPAPGMLVSLTGRVETRRAPDGTVDLSSTLPTVALTLTEKDRAVFGVLTGEIDLPAGHWLEDKSGRFAAVNALGEGRVWVTDRNGPIVAGDLLTTSLVPGYAQRQRDRIQRPHTLGKAIETVNWEAVTTTIHHDGQEHRRALIAVIYTSG